MSTAKFDFDNCFKLLTLQPVQLGSHRNYKTDAAT
jgi:hypothetical protein